MKDIPWEALVGLVALLLTSLPQLTSRARLRRKMSFWAEQVQSTDIGYDRDLAEGFRRQASAKLLAVEAYPAYTFLIPLYVALTGLLGAFLFGAQLGAIYPHPVDARSLLALVPPPELIYEVSGPGFIFVAVFWMTRVIESRRQIADKYLTARVIERKGPERSNAPWARVIGLMAFSVGSYGLIVTFVFILRIGPAASAMTTFSSFVVSLSALGSLMATVAGFVVWEHSVRGAPSWKHPILLSDEAAATRLSQSEQQGGRPRGTAVVKQAEKPWWQRLLHRRHGSLPGTSDGQDHH